VLYETISHPYLLLIFCIAGLIAGFVFDVGNFIKFLFANKKVTNFIFDILETIFAFVIFYIFNLKFNYGCVRFFPILIFFVVFSVERFTFGKIIAKIYLTCYNWLNKVNKKIWSKFKSGKTNKND